MEIKIGCDPEVFVTDGTKFVPAWDMIPGTKAKPHPVPNGTVQVDGLALEVGITPANSSGIFDQRVSGVMNDLIQLIPDGLVISTECTAHFDDGDWEKLPKAAKQLGCDVDYDAYEGRINEAPINIPQFRVAGGHVHIGWTEGEDPHDEVHFATCKRVAQQLDVALGVPSVYEDTKGAERRKMYGHAGCFRPKSYGMEYRTLSNYWIFSRHRRKHTYIRALQAMQQLQQQVFYPDHLPDDWARSIINGRVSIPRNEVFNIINERPHLSLDGPVVEDGVEDVGPPAFLNDFAEFRQGGEWVDEA